MNQSWHGRQGVTPVARWMGRVIFPRHAPDASDHADPARLGLMCGEDLSSDMAADRRAALRPDQRGRQVDQR